MKTRSYFSSGTFLALGILGLLPILPLRSDPLRLGPPVILSNRAVELNLTGQAGTGYSVEASLNFSNWFLVSSGIATNGVLSVRHDAASNFPALFYRAKGTNTSLPPLTVSLKTDTNLNISTLVSLAGGSGVLYGRDGTRFTLNLPSNSIPDAGMLTMTLVTNIGGLPFARGILGAVLLEPTNLVFWGAAALEITFPTNTDRREVVSFFSRGDGSSFQLTPDRVGTNRSVIPVTRSGTFGSSLATASELASAARIGTVSGQQLRTALAKKSGPRSSTSECFPEKQAAADAVAAQIDAARDAKSREIAALLGAAREKQMLGETDDSSGVLAQVADELCAFYTSQIAPRWTAASGNCALGKVLIQNTLGIERQRELLGANDDCTAISNIPFCDIFESCLQDTSECCGRGMKGSAKVAEVLGLQRQDQLLGLNCIDEAEAQQVIALCSSNAWTGTFSLTARGVLSMSTNQAGTTTTTITDYKSDFNGYINESVDGGFPLSYADLTIVGVLDIHDHFERTVTRGPYPCSSGNSDSYIKLEQADQIVATNTTYKVFVGINEDKTFQLTAYNLEEGPSHPGGAPWGTYKTLTYSRQTQCDGAATVNSFTQSSKSSDTGRGFNLLFADRMPMTSSNVVSGTFIVKGDLNSPVPIVYTFKWNFIRQEVEP